MTNDTGYRRFFVCDQAGNIIRTGSCPAADVDRQNSKKSEIAQACGDDVRTATHKIEVTKDGLVAVALTAPEVQAKVAAIEAMETASKAASAAKIAKGVIGP